ncbi:low affinity iron permease family protein [bacterium]|nr:MAG: low affinity iron permease family protein [bacterium]
MHEFFNHTARKVSEWAGSQWSFLVSILVILVWGITGPLFHFSDTWQLVINTGTTIITFLMVFLIQNTQNRDSRAIHLKLDEIIRCTAAARDSLIDLEEATDEELSALQKEFEGIKRKGGAGAEDVLEAIADERKDRQE